jgi:hypothetical protein
MVLGPTHPLIQWIPGALSLEVKRQGREADHSPPSSAEVKECAELYLHSPSTPSWRGAQLKKHRENIVFTFIIIFIRSHIIVHITKTERLFNFVVIYYNFDSSSVFLQMHGTLLYHWRFHIMYRLAISFKFYVCVHIHLCSSPSLSTITAKSS